jgi:phosphatidylserine synthase
MKTQSQPAQPLLRQLSGADWVTVAAVAVVSHAYWAAFLGRLWLATGLAFVAMFLDYLDGAVARARGGSPYGAVLDSLGDILIWVLFPALVINIQLHFAWWSIAITTLYMMFAVIRLGRFTVTGYVKTDKAYFTGLPVLFSKYALLLSFVPHFGWLALVWLAAMMPLMVSSRLIPKPNPLVTQSEIVIAAIFIYLALTHGR